MPFVIVVYIMNRVITALFVALIMVSCAKERDYKAVDAEFNTICHLQENFGTISEPMSFDMVNESMFVLTDWNKVFLYDCTGRQIRQIGSNGRSTFEYNMPSVVHVHGELIYVWSAMTLKFIAYNIEGTPIKEYPYSSGLADFDVSEDYIFIYTRGRADDNIIDVLDKNTGCVVKMLTPSSAEHRLLSHRVSVAPIAVENNHLLYCPKDRLTIFSFDASDLGKGESSTNVESTSFVVNKLNDPDLFSTNRNAARQYLNENSRVLILSPRKDGCSVFTVEGKTEVSGEERNESGRFICKYDVKERKSKLLCRYTYPSFGTECLFSVYNDNLYVIKHSIEDGADSYHLVCLK